MSRSTIPCMEPWDEDRRRTEPWTADPLGGTTQRSSDAPDLLASGEEWWLTACFDWPRDKWYGYILGYRRAADVLVSHIANTGSYQDTVVYPYVMCWRHYVELELKTLIVLFQRFLRKDVEIKRTHRIDLLWSELRRLFEESGLVKADAALAEVDEVLRQLHQLDPTSEHFRYPVVASGGTGTLPGLRTLNLRRFHEAMETAANCLDGCDSMIRQYIDDRNEMEAAYMVSDADGFLG
jgi:hypothetical protein